MSWSLRLHNGDFVPNRGSLSVARNETKLIQDLKCYILEEIGNDPYHPEYGSKLNGGQENGIRVQGVLGLSGPFAQLEVESELRRIVSNYQQLQLLRARTDQVARGRISLDRGEVLVALSGITFTYDQDRMTANLTLQTGDGNTFQLGVPIQT
jgi:hypothetical protein